MENEVILSLAYSPWDIRRTDNDEMHYLSMKNEIIYVEKQDSRTIFNARFPYIRFFQPLRIKRIKCNITIFSTIPRLPLSLSIFHFPEKLVYISVLISKYILKMKLRATLKKLKIQPTLLWCYEPWDLLLAGCFGEKMVCYRVYDEISLFPGLITVSPAIKKIEEKVLKRADIIFASSFSQFKKRKGYHSDTYFIPHGCDFSLYNQVLYKNFEKPKDIQNLPFPIIGFLGTIDHRINWPLIIYLAQKRPQWSILLMGRVKNVPERYSLELERITNISLLVEKRPEETLAYLKFINVSIMPYLVTELLLTAFPRKLYEHLAAGKPIVSTDWPEVRPFRGTLRLAKDKKEFLKCVDEELINNSAKKIEKRVEIAKQNSWDKRLDEMSNLIDRMLIKRSKIT